MNYKMQNAIQKFFSSEKKMFHKFKFEGKEHVLTPFDIEDNDPRLIQSFTNYCKKNTKDTDGGSGSGTNEGQGINGEMNEGNSTGEDDTISFEDIVQGEAREAVESDKYNKLFNEVQTKKGTKGVEDEDSSMRSEVKIPADISSTQLDDIKIIQKEFTRLSEIRTKKKDKLNMPKVFEALLSQPHTALEKKKNKDIVTRNLVVFVDTAVGYHEHINGCKVSFHNSIIYACKDLPFVELFYNNGMYNFKWKNENVRGIEEALKKLSESYEKKHKKIHKILVFTQGCGSTSLDNYKGYEHLVEFLTPFAKGRSCGCRRIKNAENQHCKMNYSVFNAHYLKKLKV